MYVFEFIWFRYCMCKLYLFIVSQVVNQDYASEVVTEYVIRGNTAILKCTIPSFVADFVIVNSWISSDGQEYHHSNDGYGRP